ncbi:hypothetical protein JCGZ_11219 [Jatropha curcas]|uniref:Uncharacterized protein n=1 Tax=Jatropha curcas TaxID=180498 RepID=A0A067KDP0_JATCU|nr:hypothetical protein JCGZ_11219 [Jatropha curcas]
MYGLVVAVSQTGSSFGHWRYGLTSTASTQAVRAVTLQLILGGSLDIWRTATIPMPVTRIPSTGGASLTIGRCLIVEAAAEAEAAMAAPAGPAGVVLGDVPFSPGMEVVLDPGLGLGSAISIPADHRQAPPPPQLDPEHATHVPAQRYQELCQRFGFVRSFIARLYSERHERVEMCIIWHIIEKKPFNLCHTICDKMRNSPKKLPYSMVLTPVFEFLEVKLNESEGHNVSKLDSGSLKLKDEEGDEEKEKGIEEEKEKKEKKEKEEKGEEAEKRREEKKNGK